VLGFVEVNPRDQPPCAVCDEATKEGGEGTWLWTWPNEGGGGGGAEGGGGGGGGCELPVSKDVQPALRKVGTWLGMSPAVCE